MSRYRPTIFLTCLTSLIIAGTPIFSEQQEHDDHAIVNSKPLSLERLAFIEETKQIELQEEEKEHAFSNETSLSLENRTEFPWSRGDQDIDPPYYHWLDHIDLAGDCIMFEDDSHWKVAPEDLRILTRWRPRDSLVFSLNKPMFGHSPYKYLITNNRNRTHVRANLFKGSLIYDELMPSRTPFSHMLQSIDRSAGHVFLEDGSTWQVTSKDIYLLDDWDIRETIMFGKNEEWISSYPYLLLNVECNQYVRAKRL